MDFLSLYDYGASVFGTAPTLTDGSGNVDTILNDQARFYTHVFGNTTDSVKIPSTHDDALMGINNVQLTFSSTQMKYFAELLLRFVGEIITLPSDNGEE